MITLYKKVGIKYEGKALHCPVGTSVASLPSWAYGGPVLATNSKGATLRTSLAFWVWHVHRDRGLLSEMLKDDGVGWLRRGEILRSI